MKKIIIFIFFITCFYGCVSSGKEGTDSCIVIVPPPVNITTQKTIIERQIIGDYEEISNDAWLVSSAPVPDTGKTRVYDESIKKAVIIRALNQDILQKYKLKGYIGEIYNGYVGIVNANKIPDAQLSSVKYVVESENDARKQIFKKITDAKSENDKRFVEYAFKFAEEQFENAKKGEFLFTKEGKWVQK